MTNRAVVNVTCIALGALTVTLTTRGLAQAAVPLSTIERLVAQGGDQDSIVLQRSLDSLIEIGAPAVETLIAALRSEGDENAQLRLSSVIALINIEDARAVRPLIETLNDQFPMIRAYSVHGLGVMADPRAVDRLLITAQQDAVTSIREDAVRALGKIGGSAAGAPLVELLRESGGVRRVATSVLIQAGDSVAGALEDRIRVAFASGAGWDDAKHWEQEAITEVLVGISTPRSMAILMDQIAGLHAVGHMRGARAPLPPIRSTAIMKLGQYGKDHPEVIPTLMALLNDTWTRRYAIDALDSVTAIHNDSAILATIDSVRAEVRRAAIDSDRGDYWCCTPHRWCRERRTRAQERGLGVGQGCTCDRGRRGTIRRGRTNPCESGPTPESMHNMALLFAQAVDEWTEASRRVMRRQ